MLPAKKSMSSLSHEMLTAESRTSSVDGGSCSNSPAKMMGTTAAVNKSRFVTGNNAAVPVIVTNLRRMSQPMRRSSMDGVDFEQDHSGNSSNSPEVKRRTRLLISRH